MQGEQDAIAKSRARRKAPPGEVRPGVQYVTDDAAARLDERIAEKQRASVGPRATAALEQLEQDVQAKRQARPAMASSMPGAVGGSGAAAAASLSQFERDIQAKNQARGDARPTEDRARAELSNLESDVVAKNRARPVGHAAVGAHAALNDLEAAVSSKTRASVSGSTPMAPTTVMPGAREALNDLEDSIATKARASETPAPVLTSDDVMPGASRDDEISRLDARIAAKTREFDMMRQNNNVPPVAAAPTKSDLMYGDSFEPPMQALGAKKGVYMDEPQKGALDGDMDLPQDKMGVPPQGGNGTDVEYGVYDGEENLAVATAVEEDEDDAYIPAAVEYDPDAKPPIYKNRRFRLYGLMGCVLLLLLAIGASVAVLLAVDTEDTVVEQTAAPTTARQVDIDAQLKLIVGAESLEADGSLYKRAMDWIIEDDLRVVESDAPNLVQRYLLALFYFETSQNNPWLSCNAPGETDDASCLYQRLIGIEPHQYTSVPSIRWLSRQHECNWAGVICDESSNIRAIELFGQDISGELPEYFEHLPYLQSINFNWNAFVGTIPTSWARLSHLLNLELHYNLLTGTFPLEILETRTLQRVGAGGNMLTGTIPTEIGRLSDLKSLFVYYNDLVGTVPTEIGELSALRYIRISGNMLTGQIPSEIGRLDRTTEMWVHRNFFKGDIPTELGDMESIIDFRAHFTELDGTIPTELYGLTTLQRFDVYDCNMTGIIDPLVGQMSALETFRLRNNRFHGTVPTELGSLPKLESLWLQFNDFSGEVPQEVCDVRGPDALEVLMADCAPEGGAGSPRLECQIGCCTECCDPILEECVATRL